MRVLLTALLLAPLFATMPDPASFEEFAARRKALREDLKGSAIVLFGATEGAHGNLRGGFFQEENFYYLTGWREPGAILLLAPTGGGGGNDDIREVLFLPSRNSDKETWTGRKLAPGDQGVSELTGFKQVLPAERFEQEMREAASQSQSIYALTSTPMAKRLETLLPMRDIQDVRSALVKQRMVKSPAELARMRRAIEGTIAAHKKAWATIRPGVWEYEAAALMAGEYLSRGCERHAYAPIVGAGANSVILHYAANRSQIKAGEVVLMDVGAECDGYASDLTRTIPAGEEFTERQKEIYDIVLGAQKAVIAAVKPGMTIARTGPNSLYQIALEYFNSHGKDRQGEALGKYFTHGIGHHIGLEVHDAADNNVPLAPGMVITVEPGLYIPEEEIGIRIEDMVLVTENGAEVMTAAIPKELSEVERRAAP